MLCEVPLLRNIHKNICFSGKIRKIQGRPLLSEGICVEVLRPSQPNEVMSSAVSLPNHTFTGQA